jgi:hypothetical protein
MVARTIPAASVFGNVATCWRRGMTSPTWTLRPDVADRLLHLRLNETGDRTQLKTIKMFGEFVCEQGEVAFTWASLDGRGYGVRGRRPVRHPEIWGSYPRR